MIDGITEWINKLFANSDYVFIFHLISAALLLIGAYIAIKVLKAINKRVFDKMAKQKKGLHVAFLRKFFEILIVIVVIIVTVVIFSGTKSLWNTILGGTSLIIAIATFVAQDVIKDIIAGLMISIYKPFDIGDRIEFDSGVAGVVEDINLRHVVITKIDTLREVIPNSKINTMSLVNYSYNMELKSVHLKFDVAYDSDVALVKHIIHDVIVKSEKTVPGRKGKDGKHYYSPVYFWEYAESSLVMAVTVYYKDYPTEIVRDEINTKVNAAFKTNGIEIPYKYVNVISK